MKLYIDKEFWLDFYKRLDKCKKEVYLQFMTFEGDKTGLKLSNKLIELSKRGIKINLLIDTFTDFYVSDTFYKNPKVAQEVLDTKQMMIDMRKAGISLKRTRPYGFLGKNFLARNHKKIIIIDNYAYLGGINISDHNKDWLDFMLGIKSEKIIETIKKDFLFTFSGKEVSWESNNIYTSKNLEKIYLKLISDAKEEVIISSPYVLDLSLIDLLSNKKGIKKTIITVENNNLAIMNWMGPYLLRSIQNLGVKIFFYKKFSHAKFLIVDRKFLIVGSSNFGKESFLTKQEIGLLVDDKEFIDDFYKRVILDSEIEECKKVVNNFISYFLSHFIYFMLFVYAKFIAKNIPVLKKEKFNS